MSFHLFELVQCRNNFECTLDWIKLIKMGLVWIELLNWIELNYWRIDSGTSKTGLRTNWTDLNWLNSIPIVMDGIKRFELILDLTWYQFEILKIFWMKSAQTGLSWFTELKWLNWFWFKFEFIGLIWFDWTELNWIWFDFEVNWANWMNWIESTWIHPQTKSTQIHQNVPSPGKRQKNATLCNQPISQPTPHPNTPLTHPSRSPQQPSSARPAGKPDTPAVRDTQRARQSGYGVAGYRNHRHWIEQHHHRSNCHRRRGTPQHRAPGLAPEPGSKRRDSQLCGS